MILQSVDPEQHLIMSPEDIMISRSGRFLFPDYFYKHPFPAFTVKLAVKDLLPGTKIELTVCNCYNSFTTHQSSFYVSVGIILETIVLILGIGFFRSKFFEPYLEIVMQPLFVIIDENTCTDVHCINKAETFSDTTFQETLFHLPGNIDKCSSGGSLKP